MFVKVGACTPLRLPVEHYVAHDLLDFRDPLGSELDPQLPHIRQRSK